MTTKMKTFLKWVGIGVAVLLVLLVIGGTTMLLSGKSKMQTTFEVTGLLQEVPSDSATIAYGKHLSQIHACQDCHGDAFEGKVFADAPPFLMVAPNLTGGAGGVGERYTVADWDRSIRYGVRPDGTSLLLMPARTFHNLSDEDAGALIAYLQALPPVDNTLPAREIRPLGQLLLGGGALDIAMEVHTAPNRKAAPPAGATAEYGAYVGSITCVYCHGADLNGGPPIEPGTPPVPSLSAASGWTYELFTRAMREGIAPEDRELAPIMPSRAYKFMTDTELRALHAYLNAHFSTGM